MDIKNIIYQNIKNIPGKKTKRKIVVFFVDDYGSIRVKNKSAREQLLANGVPMDSKKYSNYDTLASTKDMEMLFDILTSVKDKNGNFACFTPFTIVANPDFKKIKSSGYNDYFRESFIETLKSYGKDYEGVFELWKQGIAENVFYPAYHGTEHINVKRFMKALQSGHQSTHLAFDVESVNVPSLPNEIPVKNATATFDIESKEDNEKLQHDIEIGLNLFEELFGYRSKQFTPGAGIYSLDIEHKLHECGIKYINVGRYSGYPQGSEKSVRKFLFTGKNNILNQKYIVRNCVFEPTTLTGVSNPKAVYQTLLNIESAFRWGAPAIISSHRVNFVGQIEHSWRDYGLSQLSFLLLEIMKRWPNVEFMNGDQMAEEILG